MKSGVFLLFGADKLQRFHQKVALLALRAPCVATATSSSYRGNNVAGVIGSVAAILTLVLRPETGAAAAVLDRYGRSAWAVSALALLFCCFAEGRRRSQGRPRFRFLTSDWTCFCCC